MKHVKTYKWGWLVVAAVLVMGFVACTNEDSLTDAPAGPQNAQKVHITVGERKRNCPAAVPPDQSPVFIHIQLCSPYCYTPSG